MIKEIKNISGAQLDWGLGVLQDDNSIDKIYLFKEVHFDKLCEFATNNSIEVYDYDDNILSIEDTLKYGFDILKNTQSKGIQNPTNITGVYHNQEIFTDYLQARAHIMNAFRWANGHTDEEIDVVIGMFAFDPTLDKATNDTNKVTYLMTTKGMTLTDAQSHLLKSFGDFHSKEKESYSKRRHSKRVSMIVAKYLSFTDARDFIETTKTLLDLYKNDGIVGVNYGLVGEGIIDYIDSTVGTSYEFVGLSAKGYTFNDPSMTLENLRSEIKDVLINGNY